MPDTTPSTDVVTIGTAAGAALFGIVAAIGGWLRGNKEKKAEPPQPVASILGGALVDSMRLSELAVSIDNLAEAIRDATSSSERISRDDTAAQIKRLGEHIDEIRGAHR